MKKNLELILLIINWVIVAIQMCIRDRMKAIHDTKNKTTIYRDETFFEKTFARG